MSASNEGKAARGIEEGANESTRCLASDGGRSQSCAPYMGSGSGWLAGDWPSTRGVLNITAAAWPAGFH